eukprot:g963.t1
MAAVMVPDRIGSDQDQEARDGDDGSRVSGPSVAELEQRVGKLKEAFVGAVQKCNRAQLKAVQLQDRLDFQETQLRFLWKYVSRKVVKVESGASELGHDPAGVQILKALKESIDDMKSCIKKHEITRIAAHRQDIANGRNTFENWLRLATPSPKKRPPRGARQGGSLPAAVAQHARLRLLACVGNQENAVRRRSFRCAYQFAIAVPPTADAGPDQIYLAGARGAELERMHDNHYGEIADQFARSSRRSCSGSRRQHAKLLRIDYRGGTGSN